MDQTKEKEGSTGTVRRLIRQQSITRGTASSIAKMVRPTKTPAVSIPDQKKNFLKANVDLSNSPSANRGQCDTHKQVGTPSDSSIENSSDIQGSEAPSFESLTSSSSSSTQGEEEMIPKPNSHYITLKLSESTHSTKSIKPNANTPETPGDKLSVGSITQNTSCCYGDIPHYMSRPICGACNRNVKVTSSPVKRSQHSVSSDRELPTPTNSPRPYSPSSPTPINNHMLASDYQDVQQDEGRKEEREGINFDNIASIRDIVSISKRQINEILKADNNALAKKILKHQLDLMNKLESMESFQMSPSAPNLTTASTVMPVMMMNVENVSPVTRLSECLYTELNRPTQNWDKSMTHIKWSLGKMIGNLAGTGEIQDLDFDDYGYPKHVLISGTCITNEHKLLPKRLQKFHNHKYNLACYSYLIEMTRQKRLQEFQLISDSQWISDDTVSCCEFVTPLDIPQRCTVKFGLLNRRHHCRSCGHIFCQKHSANRLALFSPRGTECGEWARVCDTCFYSKVGSFLKRY